MNALQRQGRADHFDIQHAHGPTCTHTHTHTHTHTPSLSICLCHWNEHSKLPMELRYTIGLCVHEWAYHWPRKHVRFPSCVRIPNTVGNNECMHCLDTAKTIILVCNNPMFASTTVVTVFLTQLFKKNQKKKKDHCRRRHHHHHHIDSFIHSMCSR